MDTFPGPQGLVNSGAVYSLPETVCSTVARVNPDYPTIYERNAAWVMQFLPFDIPEKEGTRTPFEQLLENRYPLWESLVYPVGIAERVFHSSCVTSLMFEVDDVALLRHATLR
ncbi:hypothetical protein [Streptomyces klenkii]